MNTKDSSPMRSPILPISIIIPTYSEEKWLPVLLESIKQQVFQPLEIIVADRKGTDNTRAIASSYGAKIVEGGKIAFGRNSGAKVAQGEFFLFMDADTMLPSELTLGSMFLEFIKSKADLASPMLAVAPVEQTRFGRAVGKVLYRSWNDLMRLQSRFWYPIVAPGIAMLMKREVFEVTGGFDENVIIGEDVEFFRTAKRKGYRYKKLKTYIKTSVRRFDSPKKVAKILPWIVIGGASFLAGVYAGSNSLKKYWKLYGNLGGGEGKDPTKEL